jgi:hypothetical protein
VRVFVEYEGKLRRACEISLTNRDASVYLQPAAAQGIYHFGQGAFLPGEQSVTFNYKGQFSAAQEPHVSLHQSGQVHIRTRRGPKAGPLQIAALLELRGQHVATVSADTVHGFPEYRGDRENLHADFDRIVYVEDGLESGRFAIYLNGESPTFAAPQDRIAFTLTIQNAQLPRPLYLGLAPRGQLPLSDEEGVVAIAGFDPDGRGDDFLFLRGV